MRHYEATDHATTISRLKHELRALGMLADVPLGLVLKRGKTADDLAQEFDHWCLCVLSSEGGNLTVRQRALLNALDAYFDTMSIDGQEQLWTEDAIRNRPEWADIRGLACQALSSFGWELESLQGQGLDTGGMTPPHPEPDVVPWRGE